MALSLSSWGVAQTAAGGGITMAVTSSAISVTAGSLQVVCFTLDAVNGGSTQDVSWAVTDNIGDTGGGTWAEIARCTRGSVLNNAYFETSAIWARVIGTSPGTSKTITLTGTGAVSSNTTSTDGWLWADFIQVTGQAGSPFGANTGTTSRQAAGPTSFTCTLGSSPASTSAVLTVLHADNSTTPATVPSGYTQTNESHPAWGATSAAAYKNGSASTTAVWTGLTTASNHLGAAFEIVAASGGGTAISASGALSSAATGSLVRTVSAAGGVASAATATASRAVALAATGAIASAASASTGTAISASGGVASAASAALVNSLSATGGTASAGSGALVRAIAAAGGTASAGTLDLYQSGGLPSRFQGTQSFTRAVSIAGTQVHTLTCWVRATTTASIDANCVQLTNSTGTDTDSSRIGVVDVSGTFSVVFVQHRTGAGSTAVLPAVSGSQWHHFALVIDGTNQVSYVDGAQVDSRAFDPSLRTTAFTTIAIGQNFGGSTPDNAIQDVQVYTSALSAADIKTVIRGSIPAGATLYARWMLQTGAPLQDISGNARPLTQVGTWAGASFAPLYGPGGSTASASSGTLGAGAVAISGSGAIASAAAGALQNRIAATGALSSAGSAALSVAASLTAAGGVASAATAGTGLSLTATGGVASAATGTAAKAAALAGTGAVASASSAAFTVAASLTATGAVQSAGTAAFTVAASLTATGAIQSAGTTTATVAAALAAAGGVASAASGTAGSQTPITASGGVASAGTATAAVSVALGATGGVASAGTAARTVAASLTAAGGVASAATASPSGGGGIAATGATASAGTAALSMAALMTATGADASAGTASMLRAAAMAATGGVASAGSVTASVSAALAATGAIASAASSTATRGLALVGSGGVASAASASFAVGAIRASGALQLAAAGVLAASVALGASSASASAATGTLTSINANALVWAGWSDGGDLADVDTQAAWTPEAEASAGPHGAWASDTEGQGTMAHGRWAENPVSGGTTRTWIAAAGGTRSASTVVLSATNGQPQPNLAGTIGGGLFWLQKDWQFGSGAGRNLGDATALNAQFTYHDPFGTITNGTNYGALIMRAPGAPTFGVYNWADIGMSNDQQLVDPGTRYRSFTSSSMLANVMPLNTGSTVVGPASTHNAGCGSLVSQYTLSAGGARLGQDIVWETRARIVSAPNGYWFALWMVGPQWDGGPELDTIEAFSSSSPNVNGDLFNANAIGGTNAINYFDSGWDSDLSLLGIPGYAIPNGAQSLRNWHTFTLCYRKNNTFTMWLDNTVIQSGTLDWKVPSGSTVPPLSFLFDFGFGHTGISPINTAVISDITATPLQYEIDYSRIWLR